MKILFLVPYPQGKSPSQRFRFEQYFGALASAGHQYKVKSFLSEKGWDRIYTSGWFGKAVATTAGFARRIAHVLSATSYDVVFIHREAAPLGPPVFEWMIAKVLGKKIIYDFDDAIWMTDNTNESSLVKIIRWRRKVGYICKISFTISCGNEYLCAYARKFNTSVVHIPTTIDTSYHVQRRAQQPQPVVVGWTGSHTTLKYLDGLVPALQSLEDRFPEITFLVIANKKPALPLRNVRFVKWSTDTEIDDLSGIDIGVMPLPDDEWSKGKCGFKILQYMAMGIPALASPVGVNTTIIKDGVNGFICRTSDEWVQKISLLIKGDSLRRTIGEAGRQTVENNYSVNSNSSSFLSLFGRSAIMTSASK
jgi:glycosyltransferase involved in cell wall biosynthesis